MNERETEELVRKIIREEVSPRMELLLSRTQRFDQTLQKVSQSVDRAHGAIQEWADKFQEGKKSE